MMTNYEKMMYEAQFETKLEANPENFHFRRTCGTSGKPNTYSLICGKRRITIKSHSIIENDELINKFEAKFPGMLTWKIEEASANPTAVAMFR